MPHGYDQEGLPAYWGIETRLRQHNAQIQRNTIRKDYPLIGVLKLDEFAALIEVEKVHQEGLPAYWGIETPSLPLVTP